jgi:hypothetical protein
MFRRVGNYLVNLRTVSLIELYGKRIEYLVPNMRWSLIFTSGGSYDLRVNEEFADEKKAEEAFAKLTEEVKQLK